MTIAICFHSQILKYWHISLQLAHIFPIKILHFLPSAPTFSHSEVSVTACSWEHFCVYIKSVFSSSLAEKRLIISFESV